MKKNRLRFMAALLAISMLFCAFPLSAFAAFSDVPTGAWYKPHVERLAAKHILGGTGGSRFSPQRAITRAEFTAALAKTVLTAADIQEYAGSSPFSDVGRWDWHAPYIRWAYETGIVNGVDSRRFAPNRAITRAELATMIVKFNDIMGYRMRDAVAAVKFRDQSSISSWALTAVQRCQRAGIVGGYPDGTFRPANQTIRAEAAVMYDRFLEKSSHSAYKIIRKRINGFNVSAVEFSPGQYGSGIATANGRINGSESMSSMINRTGAKIAINAAYFDMDSYTPNATIVSGGRLRTIDLRYTPHKPSFVVNHGGKASIQHMRAEQTAVLKKADGRQFRATTVITNRSPSHAADTSRIIFTRDWGTQVGIFSSNYLTVDGNGKVIGVGRSTQNISIPEKGFVLFQRARKTSGNEIFDLAKVGDYVQTSVTYKGSSEQNIQTAVAAGPRIVKDGYTYANYSSEGFFARDITKDSRKRVAIGIKSDGKIIMLTTTSTMAQLSNIMLDAGCRDAMNLDGGSSSGIYCDGKWITTPGRRLNNMIYFK